MSSNHEQMQEYFEKFVQSVGRDPPLITQVEGTSPRVGGGGEGEGGEGKKEAESTHADTLTTEEFLEEGLAGFQVDAATIRTLFPEDEELFEGVEDPTMSVTLVLLSRLALEHPENTQGKNMDIVRMFLGGEGVKAYVSLLEGAPGDDEGSESSDEDMDDGTGGLSSVGGPTATFGGEQEVQSLLQTLGEMRQAMNSKVLSEDEQIRQRTTSLNVNELTKKLLVASHKKDPTLNLASRITSSKAVVAAMGKPKEEMTWYDRLVIMYNVGAVGMTFLPTIPAAEGQTETYLGVVSNGLAHITTALDLGEFGTTFALGAGVTLTTMAAIKAITHLWGVLMKSPDVVAAEKAAEPVRTLAYTIPTRKNIADKEIDLKKYYNRDMKTVAQDPEEKKQESGFTNDEHVRRRLVAIKRSYAELEEALIRDTEEFEEKWVEDHGEQISMRAELISLIRSRVRKEPNFRLAAYIAGELQSRERGFIMQNIEQDLLTRIDAEVKHLLAQRASRSYRDAVRRAAHSLPELSTLRDKRELVEDYEEVYQPTMGKEEEFGNYSPIPDQIKEQQSKAQHINIASTRWELAQGVMESLVAIGVHPPVAKQMVLKLGFNPILANMKPGDGSKGVTLLSFMRANGKDMLNNRSATRVLEPNILTELKKQEDEYIILLRTIGHDLYWSGTMPLFLLRIRALILLMGADPVLTRTLALDLLDAAVRHQLLSKPSESALTKQKIRALNEITHKAAMRGLTDDDILDNIVELMGVLLQASRKEDLAEISLFWNPGAYLASTMWNSKEAHVLTDAVYWLGPAFTRIVEGLYKQDVLLDKTGFSWKNPANRFGKDVLSLAGEIHTDVEYHAKEEEMDPISVLVDKPIVSKKVESTGKISSAIKKFVEDSASAPHHVLGMAATQLNTWNEKIPMEILQRHVYAAANKILYQMRTTLQEPTHFEYDINNHNAVGGADPHQRTPWDWFDEHGGDLQREETAEQKDFSMDAALTSHKLPGMGNNRRLLTQYEFGGILLGHTALAGRNKAMQFLDKHVLRDASLGPTYISNMQMLRYVVYDDLMLPSFARLIAAYLVSHSAVAGLRGENKQRHRSVALNLLGAQEEIIRNLYLHQARIVENNATSKRRKVSTPGMLSGALRW